MRAQGVPNKRSGTFAEPPPSQHQGLRRTNGPPGSLRAGLLHVCAVSGNRQIFIFLAPCNGKQGPSYPQGTVSVWLTAGKYFLQPRSWVVVVAGSSVFSEDLEMVEFSFSVSVLAVSTFLAGRALRVLVRL